MHTRQYPIITEMADIDMYEDFKVYPSVELQPLTLPQTKIFSVRKLAKEVMRGEVSPPFAKLDIDEFEDVSDFDKWKRTTGTGNI